MTSTTLVKYSLPTPQTNYILHNDIPLESTAFENSFNKNPIKCCKEVFARILAQCTK